MVRVRVKGRSRGRVARRERVAVGVTVREVVRGLMVEVTTGVAATAAVVAVGTMGAVGAVIVMAMGTGVTVMVAVVMGRPIRVRL